MRRFTRVTVVAAVLGALSAWSLAAEAKQVKYVGVHPIAPQAGGGFCYIEGPHVHVYNPVKADVLYREHDGANHFVGDPVPYGYDGPRHAYYGHHPVPVDVLVGEREVDGDEIEYCYMEGPHYHYYQPAPELRFEVKGGVYWYVGDYPAAYRQGKPRYDKIDVVYQPLAYTRPVVVVAPPVAYHGPVVEVVEPRVEVVAPAVVVEPGVHAGVGVGVGVEVVAPSLEVQVGVPGLIVDHHHHHGVIVHDKVKVKRKHGHGHGRRVWRRR